LLVFSAENLDARGAINGVAPWPVRNADFTRMLGRSLHRPAVLSAPAFALKLVLRGFARELLDSRRVLPTVATSLGFPFRFPELETALRDVVA
jgi:NAD dependent epimerase/dehydratase family enzyme